MGLLPRLAIILFLGLLATILAINFVNLPNSALYSPTLQEKIYGFFSFLTPYLLIILPIFIVVLLLLYILIIRPINKLNKIISQIVETGNLGIDVPVVSKDEIGKLSKNINELIKNSTKAYQSMANSLGKEKQKEKQLQESFDHIEKEKAKDEALLSSITEAVIAVAKDQKILMFNEAASRLTGYTQSEAVGVPYPLVLRFYDEKMSTPINDFIKDALLGIETPPPNGSHIVLLRKDKSMVPILHSTGFIRNTSNGVVGAIVVLRDISHERQLDNMKDEFISVASHELRTPMSAIKGIISMIMEGDYGPINEDLKDPLKDVASSTQRLIELVNDILDVSRIEAGRLKLILGNYTVDELFGEIYTLMKALTTEKGLQLNVDSRPPEKVFGDANKYKQIMNNLLGNAVKFTDKGSITISYRKEGELMYISVTDSGMGISKDDQSKLFSKFSQLSSDQTGRPKGTGLGLYISREFAKIFGGNLWIEKSEIGKGSTFTLSVPLSGSNLAKSIEEDLTKFIDTKVKV